MSDHASDDALLTGPLADQIGDRAHQAADLAEQLIEEIKPRLRGVLHAAMAPVILVAGLVLVGLSPPGAARFGSVVFAASALVLFSVSATLHRGRWTRGTNVLLSKLDHASIFLLIAGATRPSRSCCWRELSRSSC